jgi:transcriptional regulator with XRE-family HTH domain
LLAQNLARDLLRVRTDTGATQGRVAEVAGMDRSHYSRIEAGLVNPSLGMLVAIATALGADVSVRLFPGSGPRLTDRHQARMVEAVIRTLHPSWRAHVEVPVSRPARGVIDVVLERPDHGFLVAAEFHSELRRLEQQIRWAGDKARSIASSGLVLPGTEPTVSMLLVLRSTATTRALARQFEATLRAALPARSADVVSSLRHGTTWPGPGILWVRIDGEVTAVLDRPPRGVTVGR